MSSTVIKCPSCGEDWNISKFNACECGCVTVPKEPPQNPHIEGGEKLYGKSAAGRSFERLIPEAFGLPKHPPSPPEDNTSIVIPEEITEWIEGKYGNDDPKDCHYFKVGAIAMYHKMQEEFRNYEAFQHNNFEFGKKILEHRTEELSAANAQIKSLQNNYDELKHDAQFRLDAIFDRNKEIEALKEMLAFVSKCCAASTEEIQAQSSEKDRIGWELIAFVEKYDTLHADYDKLIASVDGWEGKYHQAEAKIQELQQWVDSHK